MSEPGSPRKLSDVSMPLRHAEPKRKPRRNRRESKSPQPDLPFMNQDEFSDVTILCGDKTMYSNRCILCYYSPVFMKLLSEQASGGGGGGGKGKTKSTPSSNNQLDLSHKKSSDVRELISYIDPRVDCTLTDDEAMRLLCLADEYEIRPLMKECEKTLTQSFHQKRRSRRVGSVSTDVTLRYLAAADKYKFCELSNMCVDECVANDNSFSKKVILDCDDLSEGVKLRILDKRLENVKMALARERRNRIEHDQMRGSCGNWKK